MAGNGSVLVVGGGIGGIQASLDLAEAGFKVHLVEKSPTIGGTMAQLDKTFPTNDCAMCIMSPKLVDCARHLNINLITCSEIESLAGEAGNFQVQVRRRARYVDEEKCTGCADCEAVCPVTRKNEFDEGLSNRKAIYRPFPQAAPNVFAVEKAGLSPCTDACPAGCNAHGYVALIRERKFKEALELIRERIPLPAICGRVCGLCEEACNRENIDEAIQIRALKRFAANYERELEDTPPPESTAPKIGKGEKVAIVGSGPGGLTAAYDLAMMGFKPVVFEVMPKTGGMLRYGIPEYRLPDDVLDREVDIIRKAGVEIKTGSPVGPDLTLKGLKTQGFKAVFVSVGTQKSRRLNIEGEELAGVHPGVEFLRDIALGKSKVSLKDKVVAVIGGGNTAIDAVRSALRLGAKEAFVVYRRSREQMPVSHEELQAAEEEGIKVHFLLAPKGIIGEKGKVKELVCSQMRLGLPDASGRRRPIPMNGQTRTFKLDIVIPALGQQVDYNLVGTAFQDLETEKDLIKVDPVSLQTNIPGVFAGGDAVGAGGYVVHAIAHGHEAATSIARYIKKEDLKKDRQPTPIRIAPVPAEHQTKRPRVKTPLIEDQKRLATFSEVEMDFTEDQAVEEAKRCMDCGICCECKQCVAACKAGAINHDMKDELIKLDVGSIVLAPGSDLFEPKAMYRLGYGLYPDVVTSIQFERILSASGPYGGHIKCPSDGRLPRRIAFLQCVGSRDPMAGNEYCSSVCCMYAIKESVIAKEHEHSLEPTIFYMDIRAHGKDFDRYYERAKNQYGIHFKRARVSNVMKSAAAAGLIVEYENEAGIMEREPFDLVVLSIGFQGHGALAELGHRLSLPMNSHGFISTNPDNPVETKVPGIFICGPAQEPKDIPETVFQASAAAGAAAEILAGHRFEEVEEKTYPQEKDVSKEDPRIGVFVCHCGINIGGIVKVPEVMEYAKTLPNVVFAEQNLYTCSQDTQTHIKDMIEEHKLNRVIVTSCTPRTHEPLFQETIQEAGLNRHLFGMANIRDQCSWIHMDYPEEATEKSKDLLRMAVAKIRLVEPLPRIPLDVTQRAVVIGGGPAGMSAALSLGKQGLPVDLLEKGDHLGGYLAEINRTVDGRDTRHLLERFVEEVTHHPLVNVHLSTEIQSIEGFVGNYKTKIGSNGNTLEIEHGTTIIATGAKESVPTEYLYGKDKRIQTGLEFEKALDESSAEELPERVVFIQCVGSREEGHMYCSRVCCQETVKNAITLKEKKPAAEVYVLCRDIRTYGFTETFYQKARDLGVLFLRFEPENKPVVEKDGKNLSVRVHDIQMNADLKIPADRIVLAVRIDPADDNEKISQFLKVPLNQDGFFLEAHVKLRPVDFATEGVYLAGMAHSPKTIAESISQGRAAAARAATIISKDKYEAEATVAAVNEDLCDGCGVCVGLCEYNALEIIEKPDGSKIVELKEAVCKGCGCCVAACPSGAMEQKGFKNDQIMAEIDAALA